MAVADPMVPSVLRALLEVPTESEQVAASLVARLGRVVSAAVEVLGVDSVGLILADDTDRLRTVGFTDAPASTFEDAQVRLGEGPGIDTWRHGRLVAVTDLASDPAYRRLWQQLGDTCVRAVLSCPVRVHGALVGNVNLVRHRPHAWTAAEIRAAQAYASVVGVTLDLGANALDSAVRPAGRPRGPRAEESRARAEPPTHPRPGRPPVGHPVMDRRVEQDG